MGLVKHNLELEGLVALVVDDQDPMRKAISRVLSGMGFGTVHEEQDGQDAEEFLQENHVDFVVCDIYMRKRTGLDVVRFVRNRNTGSDIPMLIVSGESAREDVVKAADLGADDYLLKPFQAEDLEKKALAILERYLAPTPLLKCLRGGDRYLVARKLDQADALFGEALRLDSQSMRARHGKALVSRARGHLDLAETQLNEIVQLNNQYHRAYASLADIALQREDLAKGIQFLDKELSLNPKQPDRQLLLARYLMEGGRPADAIPRFREALKERPKDKHGLLGVGWAYARTRNIEKAVHYFKRVRRAHPTDLAGLDAIVRACLEAQDLKRAEHALIDEKRAHPLRTDTYALLAKFYVVTERQDQALSTLQELTAVAPDYAAGHSLLGQLRMRRLEYMEATPNFERSIEIQPTAETHLRLGQCYVEQKKWGEAMTHLLQSMVMDRHQPETYSSLGRVHHETGQICKAFFMLSRAERLGWRNPDDRELLGKLARGIRARQLQYKQTA